MLMNFLRSQPFPLVNLCNPLCLWRHEAQVATATDLRRHKTRE